MKEKFVMEMNNTNKRCESCSEKFDPEKISTEFPQYLDAPYFYGRDGAGFCEACFLGVGPLDIPKIDLET